MNCPVLTAERWRRLLDNRLTHEESDLLRGHLASDCPACEQFFDSMDELAEERLRLVLQTTEPAPLSAAAAESREAFHAVMRRVREARRAPLSPRWFQWWRGGSAAAAMAGGAAVVVLAVSVALFLRQSAQPLQTEKGVITSDSSAIHLEFSIGHRDAAGQFVVNRGVLGEQYSASASLFLRFDLPRRRYVYLAGYRGADQIGPLIPGSLGPGTPYAAGIHDARPNGSSEGISLKGVRGRYVVVGVASDAPLDPATQLLPIIRQTVDPATGLIDQEKAALLGEGIAIDAVYFDVQA